MNLGACGGSSGAVTPTLYTIGGTITGLTGGGLSLANGADMVFFEAAQTLEEVASVPKLVNGPCLLNVVRGGKTPEVNLLGAEKMGYRMAIVPGLLMKSFIGIGDAVLAELKRTHVHPKPNGDPTVRQVFNRFGADEWDELRTRFRDDVSRNAGFWRRVVPPAHG